MEDSHVTQGKCQGCSTLISKRAFAKHLETCPMIQSYKNDQNFLFQIFDRFRPDLYWMVVAAPPKLTLKELDSFLRSIWLGCCQHMSCFSLPSNEKEFYPYYFWNRSFMDRHRYALMNNYYLQDIFPEYSYLHYDFDFGNLSALKIEFPPNYDNTSSDSSSTLVNDFQLLILNYPPHYICDQCCKLPLEVNCSICMRSFCLKCLQSRRAHNCDIFDTEDILPIINSPRVGKCGYTGPRVDSPYHHFICSEEAKTARETAQAIYSNRVSITTPNLYCQSTKINPPKTKSKKEKT